MSAAHGSDQVVEDYRSSLSDLTVNNKHEINLLTVIASDYISKAVELSRVLENHISTVPPSRKLPALYVLDSIAKNVGGAYIRCLGQNLYRIFMSAYSLVEVPVRKKLDEMVKTWKEPVPGSMDTRPVFPPEITRPIETALIRFRTLDVQLLQQQGRQQRPSMPSYPPMNTPYPMPTPQTDWRNTVTLPQSNGYYQGSNAQTYPHANGYPQQPPYPQHNQYPHPQPTPPAYQPPYQAPTHFASQAPPMQDLTSLRRDIENLISSTKHQFAARHWDTGLQQTLKALLDLQMILESQELRPDQIQDIRNHVVQLQQRTESATPAPVPSSISMPPPRPVPTPTPTTYSVPPPSNGQSSGDLQALISSNALADILAAATQAKRSTPVPQLPSSVPPPHYPQSTVPGPPTNPDPPPSNIANSLLANLTALGMLAPGSSTINGATANPQSSSLFPPPNQVHPTTPPLQQAHLARPLLGEVRNDVELTNASLKVPRPQLIKALLFDARPNQCSTCGQRFLTTEDGRKKKARHLDSHFQTNQRLADSAKRIQSRSWYVDEMDWIKSRDNVDDDLELANGTEDARAKAAAEAAKNDPRNKCIPVPSDPALSKLPCPICQDGFQLSWDDETGVFVWRDAIKIGPRVYHASCHAEMKKDGANTPMRGGTPDSVLGKRKAGIPDLNATRSKATRSPALNTAVLAATTA
ncbi:MAG: hypothetical protein Q9220_003048 [cf. Caloplaca sp. 1 TL-2023]